MKETYHKLITRTTHGRRAWLCPWCRKWLTFSRTFFYKWHHNGKCTRRGQSNGNAGKSMGLVGLQELRTPVCYRIAACICCLAEHAEQQGLIGDLCAAKYLCIRARMQDAHQASQLESGSTCVNSLASPTSIIADNGCQIEEIYEVMCSETFGAL